MSKKLIMAVTAGLAFMSGTMSVSAANLKDVFDAKYYADKYQDLKEAFGYDEDALYQHFIDYGIGEGRSASPVFDVLKYRETYADLNAAFGEDWDAYVEHYFNFGIEEKRINGVAFDPVLYAEAYPDVKETFGGNYAAIVEHFLNYGMSEGRTAGIRVEFEDNDNSTGTEMSQSPDENNSGNISDEESQNNNQNINSGSASDNEENSVAGGQDGTDVQLSCAEEIFWSRVGHHGVLSDVQSIPYIRTCYGEDWSVTIFVYCDINNEPKYVSFGLDNGEENVQAYTTYADYLQWVEGYKVWILENDYGYNPYFMYAVLHHQMIYEADGSSYMTDTNWPHHTWRFETE